MQYEDLNAKLNDIKRFKITREVQKVSLSKSGQTGQRLTTTLSMLQYLQTKDYDGMVSAQIQTIEQNMNLIKHVSLCLFIKSDG